MGIDLSPHSSIRRKSTRSSMIGLNSSDHHGGLSHRQSLAFELAAAMEPEENDQASILDQLGLGDDDENVEIHDDDDPDDLVEPEEGEEEEEEEEEEHEERREQHEEEEDRRESDVIYEEEEYNDEQYLDQSSLAQQLREPRLRLRPSRITIGSTHTQNSNLTNELDPSSRRSSIRGRSVLNSTRAPKTKVSRSSLNIFDSSPRKNLGFMPINPLVHSISNEHIHSPTEVNLNREEDHTLDSTTGLYENLDSSEDEQDGEILQAGLKSTSKFLNLLKQSNTDCNVPWQPNYSTHHHSEAKATIEEIKSDRQPIVEQMMTDIVRTMTEQIRDRESQIRELKEIEIALSRTDRRALADLEALPIFLEEVDFRTYTILGKFITQSDHTTLSLDPSSKSIEDLQQIDSIDSEDEEHEESGRLTPTNARLSQMRENYLEQKEIELKEESENKKKPIENLGELKLITNSLISSLNNIHEHTQISRQTQIEIVRKLKGVKGLVFNWKTDFDSIQNSIDFISNWELELFPSTRDFDDQEEERGRCERANKIRGKFESQVKLVKDEVEKLLNDAFLNASTLLQPPTTLTS